MIYIERTGDGVFLARGVVAGVALLVHMLAMILPDVAYATFGLFIAAKNQPNVLRTVFSTERTEERVFLGYDAVAASALVTSSGEGGVELCFGTRTLLVRVLVLSLQDVAYVTANHLYQLQINENTLHTVISTVRVMDRVLLACSAVVGAPSGSLGAGGVVLYFTRMMSLVHALNLILPDVAYVMVGYSGYKLTKIHCIP